MSSARLTQLLSFYQDAPNDPFILFALAKEYEGLGQQDLALQHYLELKEKQADYVGLYYHLGKLYEALQEEKTAWAIYSEGMTIARQKGDQHALSELAGARLNLGDEDDFEE
jgi:tetratricopeptide (TPR) repeat protein